MPTVNDEHVYDITPPAQGKVHVNQHEPRPNKRADLAGLHIEVDRQHKFVAFDDQNPDPMKLPPEHQVTIRVVDQSTHTGKAFRVSAGYLQKMQKEHPNQHVFAQLAESFIEKGHALDLKTFEDELNKADRGAHEVPARRRPHHSPHVSLNGGRVHAEINGVHVDTNLGTLAVGAAAVLAVAAHMSPEHKAVCTDLMRGIADQMSGAMVDLGKGGGCFGLAPAGGKAEVSAGANVRQ